MPNFDNPAHSRYGRSDYSRFADMNSQNELIDPITGRYKAPHRLAGLPADGDLSAEFSHTGMPESFPADGSGGMPPMDQPHIVGSDDQIYPIPPGQNPNWMGVPGHSPHPESLSPSASSQGANPIAHSSADPLRRAMGLRPRGEMEALRDMGYQGSWNQKMCIVGSAVNYDFPFQKSKNELAKRSAEKAADREERVEFDFLPPLRIKECGWRGLRERDE